ncbi:hypothetical protein, partial [Bradyrhizobium sp.]|uniref:hypothetical protein n=1 Tax=Bradyrhizobium sp. TaxID=376 RepID=UPI002900480C
RDGAQGRDVDSVRVSSAWTSGRSGHCSVDLTRQVKMLTSIIAPVRRQREVRTSQLFGAVSAATDIVCLEL